jgi:PIN domain nuclease of toxin-antitoxin system
MLARISSLLGFEALIAQAITENLPILSVDAVFDRYPIQRLWEN